MSAEELRLRPAQTEDAPMLLILLQSAFEQYRGKLDPPSGAHRETLATIEHLLATERCVVAEWKGRPAGTVFYANKTDALYLHRLAVLPEFRQRGIGKALVYWVEAAAHQEGKVHVTLSVRVALPENRSYYEKLGYQITEFDFHPGYMHFTSVNMQKRLPAQNLRRVEVVPYDPTWPARFEEEAGLLRRVFGNQLVAIHHIGSTSIPEMAAKPIIDILPVVKEIRRMNAFDPTMLALGYESMGELGLPGRRYYRKGGAEHRSHHLHVYQVYNPEIDRHLAFRDYLIFDTASAQRYQQLKLELAQRFPTDIVGYMDGKDGLIKELEAAALRWWHNREAQRDGKEQTNKG